MRIMVKVDNPTTGMLVNSGAQSAELDKSQFDNLVRMASKQNCNPKKGIC